MPIWKITVENLNEGKSEDKNYPVWDEIYQQIINKEELNLMEIIKSFNQIK